MKKELLKKIFAISIIVTILSCVFLSKPTFVNGYTSDSLTNMDKGSNPDNYNSMLYDGSADTSGEDEDTEGNKTEIKKKQSIKPASVPIRALVTVLSVFPFIANKILSAVAGDNFTIWKLLTNKIGLTDIKFWDTSVDEEPLGTIRENVSIWYYSIRNIAIVGMLVVLIYIGIRMAMITVAGGNPRDQAKYKKLFVNWLVGFVLTVTLHYIMIFAVEVTTFITNLVIKVIGKASTDTNLESDLVNSTWSEIWNGNNKHPGWEFIIYCFLVYYQFKFFATYLVRALKIYFYVVISPLVCLSYSIDKIKDDKSQILDRWSAEFISELAMQPIQLITYAIFIVSADEILKAMPILLTVIMMAITKINKDVSKLLLGSKRGRFVRQPHEMKPPIDINPRDTVKGFVKKMQ